MITEHKPQKIKQILLPILGVVIAGIAIAAIAVQLGRKEPAQAAEEPDFHETAEPGTPLTVDFTRPATTAEEYELLYSACVKQMESHSAAQMNAPVVDVTEDIFVDDENTSSAPEQQEPETYTEYDRAYFEDFLMVRYVSMNGDICVVGAHLDPEDRSKAVLLEQQDFSSEHFSAIPEEETEKKWQLWPGSRQELEEELEETGSVSEETFVSCVAQCILDLLGEAEDEERLFSHFTEEGAASLLRVMQVLEIGTDSSVGIVLAEAGISEPTLETMDRLYLRFELLKGGTTVYLNFLVKLNPNMMIYDVDLI